MKKTLKEQGIPLFLTLVTFLVLCGALYLFISLLNLFPSQDKILFEIRKRDVLVGLTIYLKTSIDFAIFIGNLMRSNPGWKKRIAIEIGTALGNAAGTLVVLIVWSFFREVPILMAIMIFIASLVLLRMAEESLGEFLNERKTHPITKPLDFLQRQLQFVNRIFKPIMGKLIPNTSLSGMKSLSLANLAVFSFTIPFILGLDDFAGYIPLFSIINVFGFAVGVFLGHMILNIGLFLSPDRTVSVVKNPIVLVIGGLAFVGIAAWGMYEVVHLIEVIIGFAH